MILRNFKSCIKYINGIQAMFFTDEDGNDWYEIQKQLSDDTLKIMFDSSGKVVAASFDASTLAPDGFSVAEIRKEDVPEKLSATRIPDSALNLNITPNDDWFYKNGEVQQIRDYQELALTERDMRMAEVSARIIWLEEAQKDNDISDEEEAELNGLRAYRCVLRRLDLNGVTDEKSYLDIKWPDKPDNVLKK